MPEDQVIGWIQGTDRMGLRDPQGCPQGGPQGAPGGPQGAQECPQVSQGYLRVGSHGRVCRI